MGRKNKRKKKEYRDRLGFNPGKYVSRNRNTPAVHTPVYENTEIRVPHRGDIWFADLGCHPGTCHKELNPEAVGDLKQELNASMILAEQITTISKLQLRNYVGRVDDADLLVAIDQTIREQLGLSGPDRHDNDHHSTKNKECDCNDHK